MMDLGDSVKRGMDAIKALETNRGDMAVLGEADLQYKRSPKVRRVLSIQSTFDPSCLGAHPTVLRTSLVHVALEHKCAARIDCRA